MRKILVAATAFLVTTVGVAGADETGSDQNLFGIVIGKPVTISKCPLVGPPESPCVEKISPSEFSLRFPNSVQPSWVRQVFISTREGSVEKLLIDTSPDPAQQQAIVETLTTGYGKPEALRTLQKYNRYGAVMSVEATWHVQGIYIFYTGAESLLAGTLAIKSEKEDALEESETKTRAGK
jgi:hypothetical protein